MPVAISSARSQALEYIANDRFHRRFTLPATADHGALTVSYADIGRPGPEAPGPHPQPPTILFIPGMFASRYLGIPLHPVATTLGVRLLVVDRPGMGQSTNVALEKRVPIWVELVPLLLAHLGIKHVSLVSHSGGTMYLFNTLYHCREILHPERPFVVLLAPWVDPSHSHVTTMQMLQRIPKPLFRIWHLIPSFVVLNIGPVEALSRTAAAKFSKSASRRSEDSSIEEDYGLPHDLRAELNPVIFRSMFKDNTVGANSEALLCLRKGQKGMWGKCEDYGVFVRELADRERRRETVQGSNGERVKLKVRAYFATSDDMIGKEGQSYMEDCWRGQDEDGGFQDVIDFSTTTVAEVDHDSLVSESMETWESVFIEAGGSVDANAD